LNNFQAQISLTKLKQGQYRCPYCGSETFSLLEIKDYKCKMGKYQDYDCGIEESFSRINNNRNIYKYSVFIIDEIDDNLSEVKAKGRIIGELKHNIKIANNNKIIPINKKHTGKNESYYKFAALIHCSKCYWYKYVYQKPYKVPL